MRAHDGEERLMTDERWHHIMRIVNDAFENSETRTVSLRKRIVTRLRRRMAAVFSPLT